MKSEEVKNEGEIRNKWSEQANILIELSSVGIIGQNEDFMETGCSGGSQAARAVKPR